ncbi:MAG: MTH938/NDUFAF3 family protein [Pseudomonadota bacterium]|nr:MTH938/NDUFAF3 family protein [Pseudomonadota bacterium]
MQIDHYNFGRIDIGGRGYDADVIIFPDHVQEHWWRREGHRLAHEDLETILADPPQLLVIGTGYYGRMQVPEETLAPLRAEGVEVRVLKTSDAVAELNRLQKDCPRIVAALHLTC